LEDPGVSSIIVLKLIFKKQMEGAENWIDPAQDRDKRRAPVKVAISLCVPYNERNLLTEKILPIQGICSLELISLVSGLCS